MTKQKLLTGCSLLHLPRDKENDKRLKDSRAGGGVQIPLENRLPFPQAGLYPCDRNVRADAVA